MSLYNNFYYLFVIELGTQTQLKNQNSYIFKLKHFFFAKRNSYLIKIT